MIGTKKTITVSPPEAIRPVPQTVVYQGAARGRLGTKP